MGIEWVFVNWFCPHKFSLLPPIMYHTYFYLAPPSEYMVTVKGAPEVLQSRFTTLPENYESSYLTFARKGARVLALGYKEMGKLSHQDVRDMKREEAETDLTFAGFLIVSCPLKLHSKKAIKVSVLAHL